MNTLNIKYAILSLLIFINLNGHKNSFYKIEESYLNSFKTELTHSDIEEAYNSQTKKIDNNKLEKIINNKFIIPRHYTQIILKLFKQNEAYSKNISKIKTSRKLFQNLEVLCGEHQSNSHLLSKIDRTKSYAGKVSLAKMLLEPTTDIDELQKRQNIISELTTNKETFLKLETFLEDYKKAETTFLNFFEKNEFINLFNSSNYFPNALWQIELLVSIMPQSMLDELDFDAFGDKINQSHSLIDGINLYTLREKFDNIKRQIRLGISQNWKLIPETFKKDNADLIENTKNSKFKKLTSLLLLKPNLKDTKFHISTIVDNIRSIYYQLKEEKNKYKKVKNAYEKLINIRQIINTADQIEKSINQNSELKELAISFKKSNEYTTLEAFNVIENNFNKLEKEEALFESALKNLRSTTFKTDEAPVLYLYLLKGRILSTAYLIAKTQNKLVDFVRSIGQIDAYISIAKLYKESKNNSAQYCFPQYLDQKKSQIELQNFWSPFINSNNVITNNIQLGGNKIEKCVLISGPNAGGKSTVLKSIILNALLAQTIGIAPSKSCMITPFSYIDSYLNITDNISGGNSLFKSEVLRVKNMLNEIKSNGKSLIIVDEMFSGTNPREGQAASFAIAEHIAELSNTDNKLIALLASHYSKMTELEETTNGIFKNYKVTANINKNSHKINYPFTLQEGSSNQAIAIDLLQAENLDSKIIDSARKIANSSI